MLHPLLKFCQFSGLGDTLGQQKKGQIITEEG